MKALVLIDIQKGLTKRKLYRKDNFINTVNKAINKYRSNGDLVVFVQHVNKQLVEGSEDWELDDSLLIASGDRIFSKQQGDAFSNGDLSAFLREQNADEVLVGGLVTHGCVKHTCLGGIKAGFSTSLLQGGHSNWAKDAEEKIAAAENALSQSQVKIVDLSTD